MPTAEDMSALKRQLIRGTENPEPWLDDAYAPKGREKEVYWFVYLGELDLEAAYSSLLKLFPDDSPEPPPRTKGKSTLAVVVLDEEGRPISGKVFLSSFAWGYGRVRAGELKILAEFPEEERKLRAALEARLSHTDDEGEVLPVSAVDLQDTTSWLRSTLGLPKKEVELELVSVRVPAWRKQFEAPEPELLNSFFLEDLARARKAVRTAGLGAGLSAFLSGRPRRAKADVVREPSVLEERLAPDHIPLAHWPMRGRFPLVTMQQAAVNHVAEELRTPGLVGINGPPGTGKTTLLRDVVAHVVLQRALALEAFEDPLDAFSHVAPMKVGRSFLHLYRLDESLLGHEIVVASSNNKAVENISREIPAIDAVADDFEPPLRYFAGIADRVFQPRSEARAGIRPEQATWGLAAAVLGNSANRWEFVQAFWWDPQRGMGPYLRGIRDGWSFPEPSEDESDEVEQAPAEVMILENAPQDREEALSRWRAARQRFRTALEDAQISRRRLEVIRESLLQVEKLRQDLQTSRDALDLLQRKSSATEEQLGRAHEEWERIEQRKREALTEREAHQSLRPGFFGRFFVTRRFREWRSRMAEMMSQVESARQAERRAEAESSSIRQKLKALQAEISQAKAESLDLERRLGNCETLLQDARFELGDRLPDGHFWDLPEDQRQKLSPWLAEDFQVVRDELFAASFELHRAFVDAAAPRLHHNLGAAMNLLQGRPLSEAQEPARRSLWSSLFLVVPVVSTTFASVARMFGPLGREQLGWLLVDEAGQAVPQAAVGAIWRSQRVVGIGDPMQIPPVVTMPQRLINAVLERFGIDPNLWSAPLSSMQSLADRASWLGTTYRRDDGDDWVGVPLRVHRRCESPMFNISNQVAYSGTMVQATPVGESAIGHVLGPSAWFHVAGSRPGHWSPAEGRVAALLLQRLIEAGNADPDVFFITPFLRVQNRLREILRSVVKTSSQISNPWLWAQDRVGTIHVVQGKEAEAVVLVLGAPSMEAKGARWWAGGQPNLLNVAASRAKKRLYVVGDRESWQDAGVFKTLAVRVPQRPWE